MKTKILKFGGTSMGEVESIRKCVEIIKDADSKYNIVVVVSALSGVTDELIKLIEFAKKGKPKLIASRLNILEERHRKVLSGFVEEVNEETVWEEHFAPLFKRLRYILTGISFVGDLTDKTYAVILSYGERLSSSIMHYAIERQAVKNTRVSALRLIPTDSQYKEANVDFKRARTVTRRILMPLLKKKIIPVVPGFIGKDTHGDTTLLGRGGSDYTAAIIGINIDADAVEIWTDVDGIMSADPRIVLSPHIWDKIDTNVMAEMAYTGIKVLHPKAIIPALHRNIPVWIKNTFNPKVHGTEIVSNLAKGLYGIVMQKNQVLLQITNPNMLDEIGFINRCTEIFVDHEVSIDVCVTSEVSITCSIDAKDASDKLYRALKKRVGLAVYEKVAKLCVIGNGISLDTELLGKIFATLKGYQIYTVSIGASKNNITFIVKENDAEEILKILHKTLFRI